MAEIFDEANMRRVLGACVPEGETLLAGVHGITLQVNKKKPPISTCTWALRSITCWPPSVRSGST